MLIPFFKYELYGVGLFVLAAGNIHNGFGKFFVELVARGNSYFFYAERCKNVFEVLYYFIYAGLCGLIFCRINRITESVCNGQKFEYCLCLAVFIGLRGLCGGALAVVIVFG